MNVYDYLAKQLNGPVASLFVQSSWDMLSVGETEIALWTTLSLATASGPYLDFIGSIIGIIRPILVDQTFFRFYTADASTSSTEIGFASVADRETGGVLDSVYPITVSGTLLSDNTYRVYLASGTLLRKNLSLDNLMTTIEALSEGKSCVVAFDVYGDIRIEMESSISESLLSLLQLICSYFFTTSPQVFITRSA